jgi:hypothetical protein
VGIQKAFKAQQEFLKILLVFHFLKFLWKFPYLGQAKQKTDI